MNAPINGEVALANYAKVTALKLNFRLQNFFSSESAADLNTVFLKHRILWVKYSQVLSEIEVQ